MNLPLLRTQLIAVAATFTFTLAAHAHPGHDWNDASARHLLTSSDHLSLLALTGVTLFIGGRFVQRGRPRVVLRTAGFAAVALAGLLWATRS